MAVLDVGDPRLVVSDLKPEVLLGHAEFFPESRLAAPALPRRAGASRTADLLTAMDEDGV